MEKKVTRRSYRDHPYFNRSDEVCSFVVARKLDLNCENFGSFAGQLGNFEM